MIRRILKLAKRGTQVIYVPGNHDAAARQFHGMDFGQISVCREAVHLTADGRVSWSRMATSSTWW